MKKIILLLLFTANIYSSPTFNIDLDASDNCICDGFWEFDSSRLSSTEDWYSGDNTLNMASTCIDNEQKIIPRIDNLELASEQYDKWKFDRLFDTYLCKICEESAPPPPPPEEDPLLWTRIYSGSPSSAPSECYEPNNIDYKSYTFQTVACGSETMRCYKKYIPPYDCKSLGSSWLSSLDETESECSDLMLSVASSTSFFTGSDFTDTCCYLPKPPENDLSCDSSVSPLASELGITYTDYIWSVLSAPDINSCYEYSNGVSNKVSIAIGYENGSDTICCVGTSLSTDNTTDNTTDDTTDDTNGDADTSTDNTADSRDSTSDGTTETNDILNDIKSDINDSNNVLNDISKELNASNENLEKIKESVDSFSNRNHSDLSDINNSINNLRNLSEADADERDGIKDNLNGIEEDILNASNTITGNIATLAGSWSNVGTPFVTGGGNDFCFEVWSRRVCLDLSFLANMKPYFDILFAMILAYLNFKVYTRIVGFLLLIGL